MTVSHEPVSTMSPNSSKPTMVLSELASENRELGLCCSSHLAPLRAAAAAPPHSSGGKGANAAADEEALRGCGGPSRISPRSILRSSSNCIFLEMTFLRMLEANMAFLALCVSSMVVAPAALQQGVPLLLLLAALLLRLLPGEVSVTSSAERDPGGAAAALCANFARLSPPPPPDSTLHLKFNVSVVSVKTPSPCARPNFPCTS